MVMNKESRVGELMRKRLEEIRAERDWDVCPLWAEGRWYKKYQVDEIGKLVTRMRECKPYPWHRVEVGDKVWSWKGNNRWFKLEILTMVREKEGMFCKVVIEGEEKWIKKEFLIKGTKMDN